MRADPIVRTLEERCLNAWPALRCRLLDGWVLRFGDGFTRRANSVQALHAGALDATHKVERCEAAYAAVSQPCVFKITPLAEPPELDALLERRGYAQGGVTGVQLLEALPRGALPCDGTLCDPLDETWQAAFTRMDATPAQHRGPFRAILAHIALPHTAALLRAGGAVVSCGRAVLEEDSVGLFDIATEPGHRRQGHAGRLIGHLLAWGREHGARRAYLQVEADNAPARALYARLGFREVYRYWYRAK
jgi:N-acetylglutamate synthase